MSEEPVYINKAELAELLYNIIKDIGRINIDANIYRKYGASALLAQTLFELGVIVDNEDKIAFFKDVLEYKNDGLSEAELYDHIYNYYLNHLEQGNFDVTSLKPKILEIESRSQYMLSDFFDGVDDINQMDISEAALNGTNIDFSLEFNVRDLTT